MAPISRLGRQIEEIILCLDRLGAATALIGGLALAPYNVIRATSDVDLLADAGLADAIDCELRKLGYQCLHRSADVANYVRGDERVDFLFAVRPAAAALLASAVPHQTPFGELRVVGLEGLIAFKLQGFVNDPRRSQSAFARSQGHGDPRPTASPASDPFTSLDELMAVVEALCPVWPTRPALTVTPDLRL
jgi:hypothetical protein